MSLEAGARAYRIRHGQVTDEELPPTKTASQRGALTVRARKGDPLAKRALDAYHREKNAQIYDEVKGRTDG